jgi:hypothetical protein
MNMRLPILVFCVAALGCGSSPMPPPTVLLTPLAAPAPTAVPDERPPVSLHFESAQAFEVIAAMEAFGGEPVLVDAAALSSLRCAAVSVSAPSPLPGRAAAEMIAAALRDKRFHVDHAAGRWVVSADPTAPPAACTPPAPAPVVSAESDEAAGEVARAIRRVSDTEYVLTRNGLELLLEHEAALFRHMRIVPELKANKVVGVRLMGLREGDTLQRLGLLNGDVVERLAGHELTDPQHALEAYTAVRNASRAVLEIERRGAPVKIVYRVE